MLSIVRQLQRFGNFLNTSFLPIVVVSFVLSLVFVGRLLPSCYLSIVHSGFFLAFFVSFVLPSFFLSFSGEFFSSELR